MPQIIVTADHAKDQNHDGIMLRERVNVDDFDSERFAANLIERLGWAVIDATEVEQAPTPVPAPEIDQIAEHPRPTRSRQQRREPAELVRA